MRRALGVALLLACLAITVFACGAPTVVPTPDVDATVAAALAATSTAQAGLQQTVEAAVRGTQGSVPTPDTQQTIEAAVRATLAVAPTPTPSTVYVTLSEEELAALVDEAVAEATASAEASSAAVDAATADDTLTTEEVDALLSYLDETEALIAEAEEVLAAYESLYGELATETLAVLQAMEEDLAIIAANTEAMLDTLAQIDAALQQGLALAEETIGQLEAAAQAVEQKALQLQQQAQDWMAKLSAEWEERVSTFLAVRPADIPADRAAALRSAFDYVDAVRQALADNKLTSAELSAIAQRGAEAVAGLQAHGGPALRGVADAINDVTAKLARGQVPQAQAALGALESALGARPSRP